MKLTDLPILHSILLFSKFLLHLLEHLRVLINGLILFVDLFLERASDLHHVLVVLVDLVPRTMHIFLKVLVTERTLVQTNVQRCDVTSTNKFKVSKNNTWRSVVWFRLCGHLLGFLLLLLDDL